MKSFFLPLSTAIRFLTIVPLPLRGAEDENSFSRALYFFPVIGILIGLTGYTLATLLCQFLPLQVASLCLIVFLAFVSGCLHLDGLADSADGLLSSRPRERALEIMKDSRTGAMGVVAIVFVLLGKYAALSSMDIRMLCLSLFFMPLAGRCTLVFVMALQKYAREEGGLGQLFYSGKSKKAAALAALIMIVLFAVIAPALLPAILLTLFFTIFLFISWCNGKLGGATGDTLGAACEIAETVTALTFAAFSLMT
ncbi:MAG: adenosylcobinamide-GDP ribazoletransferase [Deltaproteobacteria bacterium]|nr:adenosylcobinamide-GDP ribazoletransferase [Deltaproteobacteria bacterium]